MWCVHVAGRFCGEICSVTNYSMAASSLLSSAPSSIIFTLSPVLLFSKGGGSWSGCANGHRRSFRAFPSAIRDCHHRSWRFKRTRKSLSVVAASASSPSSSNPDFDVDVEARISLAASTGRLDLSDCGLVELPPRLFDLTDLVDLSLAGNCISSLPEDIKNLRSLRRLGLAGNRLQELPEGIANLHNLEGLWVHGNILQSLPQQIGELRQLRMLALAGNKLAVLPESISMLTNLQILSFAGNRLQEIPAGIGNLKALTVLAAYGNCLQSLPESLALLSSLQDLWLQGNKLEVLPESLGGLCSLKQLSLSDNLLETLPESIGELRVLQTLWVYCNKIKSIPMSLAKLRKLQYIWLEGNPIDGECFWEVLPQFQHLKALGVSSDLTFPTIVPEPLKRILTLSEISGSGEAKCCGGYFKLQQWDMEKKAEKVVVAFGSAPAVPNWAGLLQKIKAEMIAKGTPSPFDILYVVDSKRSWYTHEDGAEVRDAGNAADVAEADGLGNYYKKELEIAVRPYRDVVMLGDSMGASAALMFSTLATSVIAFCPQVDLSTSSIRPGQSEDWLQTFKEELLTAVSSSNATIYVHCGTWSHDVNQAKLLPPDKVKLEVHDVNDHRLAKELNAQNLLLKLVLKEILRPTLAPQKAVVT